MKTQDRRLTEDQHFVLDRIAKDDPGAKVVDWDSDVHGPVLRHSNGDRGVVVPGPSS